VRSNATPHDHRVPAIRTLLCRNLVCGDLAELRFKVGHGGSQERQPAIPSDLVLQRVSQTAA